MRETFTRIIILFGFFLVNKFTFIYIVDDTTAYFDKYLPIDRFCLHWPVNRREIVRSFSLCIAWIYRIVTSFLGTASLNTYIFDPYSATVAANNK